MKTKSEKTLKPPSEVEYQKAKINLAFDFAPVIYPCNKCKWPVANGYCCRHCGNDNPKVPNSTENLY